MESVRGLFIDTDVVIDYLRGVDNARDFFKHQTKIGPLYLSVITLGEIYSGKDLDEESRLKIIEEFISNFEIALVTTSIAKTAGGLRRNNSRPFADMLIAASALEYGFGLATRNTKHFKNIKNLKLVKPY